MDEISGIRIEATKVSDQIEQATMAAFQKHADDDQEFQYELTRKETYYMLLGKFQTIFQEKIKTAKMPMKYIDFMSEGVFYIIKVEDTKIMLDLRLKMKWPKTQSMKQWEQ